MNIGNDDQISTVLMRLAQDVIEDHASNSRVLAEQLIARISPSVLRELAIRELKGWIDHDRRESRRSIERSVISKKTRTRDEQQTLDRIKSRPHSSFDLFSSVNKVIDDFVKETELRITDELLATFFALGNGSRVTWGNATIEQHEQRIDMLTKNATGIIETVARHARAIEIIKETGVSNLSEIPQEERVK